MSGPRWPFAAVALARVAGAEAAEAASGTRSALVPLQARHNARHRTMGQLQRWAASVSPAEREAAAARFFEANPAVRPRDADDAAALEAEREAAILRARTRIIPGQTRAIMRNGVALVEPAREWIA